MLYKNKIILKTKVRLSENEEIIHFVYSSD